MINQLDMNIKVLLTCCIAALLVSCSSSKQNLTYFENIDSLDTKIGSFPADYAVKIDVDDELAITINSTVPEATAPFNMPLSNTGTRTERTIQMTPTTLQSYIVDSNGDIFLPVIGKMHVSGLTTRQLSDAITAEVEKSVRNPHVRVQLLNFRVNVLGEVKRPGAIAVTKERYTILDAIADAQDLTNYGKRENILLIREEDGVATYHRLNLTDASLLTSPYFYLRQNDVIYVEPNKIITDNSKYNQYSGYKLSVISTVVGAVSVIASLVIALTR